MKLYYDDPIAKIYQGNALQMTLIPDGSVQCVVTSPPYWGLRKYAGEQELVWGDNHCEHEWEGHGLVSDIRKTKIIAGKTRTDERYYGDDPTRKFNGQHQKHFQDNFCSLCGAWRGAYGLEPTPEMYVQHTVEILREIKRVLRNDGVVFWNIGDSYASGKGTCFNPGGGSNSLEGHTNLKERGVYPLDRGNKSTLEAQGLKPKDLCLIPARVALAAQADGWWVRSVIIWSKPNPMPESVTDRPTESHEYILMLTEAARYYWDADAVKEPLNPATIKRYDRGWFGDGERDYPYGPQHHLRDWFASREKKDANIESGRNIRSVWEFPTQPYPETHFAVFPEALPKKCIMASTKEGDTVLDPFAGRGTVGVVAKELNRRAILIDISEEYCRLAKKCIEVVPLPMALA